MWRSAVEWLSDAVRWSDAVSTASRRRAVMGVLAVAALVLAGWGAVRALGPESAEAGQRTVAAGSSARPAPSSAPPVGTTHPGRPDVPDSLEEWRAVVAELYDRRAAAFGTAAVDVLDDVYAPGSPQLSADRQSVTALADAGQTLRGFAPAVREVTAVAGEGDTVTLTLVDRWPDYQVVEAAPAGDPEVRLAAGRPATEVRMVVVRTPEGWRISSAERTG
jgi:hypothetical protein